MKILGSPLTRDLVSGLKCGQDVLFSGPFYTARDQAHRRLAWLIENKKKLPFDIRNQVIYYCGPTANPKDRVIGSCGPTTSMRMDSFIAPLFKAGLLGMVGKGRRSEQAKKLIAEYRGIYFIAPAGCGALLSKRVISRKLVCFRELGPEAVYKLEVKDFPLIVAVDSKGKSIYRRIEFKM